MELLSPPCVRFLCHKLYIAAVATPFFSSIRRILTKCALLWWGITFLSYTLHWIACHDVFVKQVKTAWTSEYEERAMQLYTRSTLFHNPAEDKHNIGCWSEPWCWNWGQWPLTSSHSKSVRQARTVLIGCDLDLLASAWVQSPACAYSIARWLLCACVRACVCVCVSWNN